MTGPSFEDMLADPHGQFDPRSELLASIIAYANAQSGTASAQPKAAGSSIVAASGAQSADDECFCGHDLAAHAPSPHRGQPDRCFDVDDCSCGWPREPSPPQSSQSPNRADTVHAPFLNRSGRTDALRPVSGATETTGGSVAVDFQSTLGAIVDERNQAIIRADQAEAELDAANATIQRVRDLHTQAHPQLVFCDHCDESWPCPTIQALAGEPNDTGGPA